MRQVLSLSVLMALAFSPGAQAQSVVPAKPNMFSTLSACKEALASGRLRFYEPKYFGLRTQNPTNNEDRIVVPLESDTCLEMLVVGGRQFVAQQEGTLFRARKLADGSLSLYARNDCGNAVYGVVYPAPALTPAEPVAPPRREPVTLNPSSLRRDPPEPLGRPLARSRREVPPEKKGGFCSSKKCRWAMVVVGVSAGGYAAWRYWPCPPGTVRR